MKISKRILSIVLSALMVVTMLPTFAISAFALTEPEKAAGSSLESLTFSKFTPDPVINTGVANNDNNYKNLKGTYYNNVLYMQKFTGGNDYHDIATDGRTGSIYNSKVTVLMDDGETDMLMPIMMREPGQFTWGGNNTWCFTSLYPCAAQGNTADSSEFALKDLWRGGQGVGNLDWYYALTYADGTKKQVGHNSSTKSDGENCGNKGVFSSGYTPYYANSLVIKRPVNYNNSFYKKYTNIYWYLNARANNSAKTASITVSDSAIYVINYAPMATKLSAIQTEYNGYKNSGKQYTAASLSAYQNAVKEIANFNLGSYDFSTNTEVNVLSASATIASIMQKYNETPKPVEVCSTHTWVDGDIIKNATCTEDGSKNIICSVCGATSTATINKTGHSESFNSVVKTPATCTTQGVHTYSCKNPGCDYSYDVADIAINTAKEGHSYTTQVIPSTCTVQGYTLYTCSNCGEETENHSYKDNYQQLAAHSIKYTNNGDGTHRVYCENCDTMTDIVAHSFDTLKTDKVDPANCVTPGSEAVYECVCGATNGGDEIKPNTAKEYHSYTTQVIPSTCTVQGYTLYTCSNCSDETENHSYKDNYQQLAAHTPGEPVKENETTLTYDEVIKCTICGAEISRVEKKNIIIVDSNDSDASEKATVTVETVDEKQVATVTVDDVADEDARFIGWFDNNGNLLSMEKEYTIKNTENGIKAVIDNEAKNDVNATVKNNIGANFYIDTLYYVNDPETDITITYNQDINAYTNRFVQKTVKVKDLDRNADMQSIINIDVAPAQIDKTITVSFEDENGDMLSFEKSVMDYCNDVINGDHTDAEKNAAKQVINYAYAVQQYFFINEYEYLQSIETAFNTEPTVEFGQVSAYAPTVKKTSACPITVSEISIVAVTDTGVRIYYTGDASDLEFQASNGYTVTKGDGYIEVSGIKAADLGNEFVVQAKNSENKVVFQAKLSAMSYVYLALQDGKKWSVDYNRFLGAFYEYWQAALAL